MWPKINSFGSRGHQMKSFRFSRIWFFIDNFCDMSDMKTKMTASCLPRRAGSKHLLYDLERSISDFGLRSSGQGQVKDRPWPKYVNMHIFRSDLTSHVVWHHLRVSISILSRVIGKKVSVTSIDLRWPPGDHQSSVAPEPSQIGWVAMILKELVGFVWLMRNRKHF